MVTKQTSSPASLLKKRPPERRWRKTCVRVMALRIQRGGGLPLSVGTLPGMSISPEPDEALRQCSPHRPITRFFVLLAGERARNPGGEVGAEQVPREAVVRWIRIGNHRHAPDGDV